MGKTLITLAVSTAVLTLGAVAAHAAGVGAAADQLTAVMGTDGGRLLAGAAYVAATATAAEAGRVALCGVGQGSERRRFAPALARLAIAGSLAGAPSAAPVAVSHFSNSGPLASPSVIIR